MLASTPIIAFVPTKDAAKARTFYENTLGLRYVSDDQFALVMDANGTMIRIARVGEFTPAQYTILGWEVTNIERAVADLTAKGVKFHQYGFPDQSKEGIWSAPGGTKVAWFPDPDGNTLSLSQHPQTDQRSEKYGIHLERDKFRSAIRQSMNLSKEEMARLLEEEKTAYKQRKNNE